MLVCMHVGASGVYMCYACRCEHLLCVQVCMHVGVSICCVHVYACRGQCCMYIGTYVRSSASCVCVHAQGPAYIYIYISVHACLYVCMYVYAHFILNYTYTQPQVPSKKAHKYTM